MTPLIQQAFFLFGRSARRSEARGSTLIVLLLLCGIVSGCFSPKKKVAQKIEELQYQWQTNVAWQTKLPERAMDWPRAVAQLEAGNLKLRRGRFDILNGEDGVRQVFKDLIPTLNLRAGVSKSVKTLPSTSIDDVTFNIDSFFNVPGFINMSTRVFASRLVLLRAKAYYELTKREQTIELYKLFLSFQDLVETDAQIQEELRFAEAAGKIDPLAGQVLLRDLDNRSVALAREREGLQEKAGELFGNRDWRWILVNQGLPQLKYDFIPLRVEDTNSIALLQMKLAAIEFVGAWARLKGIQLQYWPEFTLFITGPPIYQRTGNFENFWDYSDVRANANFFWRIDTRGQIARQHRQTERDQELQVARLRQDAIALIDKIVAAQKLMVSLRTQVDQLERLVPLLAQLPPPTDYPGILKSTETARSLHDQEKKLRRDLAELNTLFWFVDETKWVRHDNL